MKNIALISPNQSAYSESFIQAHKELLDGNIYYYYGGFLPYYLDNKNICSVSIFKKIYYKVFSSGFSVHQNLLIQSFKKNNINCVLAEYGPTGVQMLPICQYLKIPLIVHFHGYDISVKSVIEDNLQDYKELFKYAKYIIGVSRKMCNDLEKLGALKEKIIYTCCGPQDKFLSIKPNIQNASYFLSVGRFVDKKAPHLTLEAFRIVLKKHPHARLIMCGDGLLLNTCVNLVNNWGIQHAIEFKGAIEHDTVPQLLSNAIAFVQHSVTASNGDSEGTPVGIMEASIAGLPVISTRHAGIPDVIIDGETGLLVDECDVVGMAENMIIVLENRELAMALGQAGKKCVKENFSISHHIDILDKLIFDCINSHV